MLKLKKDGAIDMEKMENYEVLIRIIGLLEALKNGDIPLCLCEKILFSPKYVTEYKNSGIKEEIVALIEECCELEDIASIIPEKFDSTIADLEIRAFEVLNKMNC